MGSLDASSGWSGVPRYILGLILALSNSFKSGHLPASLSLTPPFDSTQLTGVLGALGLTSIKRGRFDSQSSFRHESHISPSRPAHLMACQHRCQSTPVQMRAPARCPRVSAAQLIHLRGSLCVESKSKAAYTQ